MRKNESSYLKRQKKLRRFFWGSFLLIVFPLRLLWAQEVSYDRYAPVWPKGLTKQEPAPRSAEGFQVWGKHFLVYPFELVRWPIDGALNFIEEHHLYDKIDWIYDQMKNRGFTPRLRSLAGGDSLGGGFLIEPLKLAGLQDRLPNLQVEGSTLWTLDHITEYRAKVIQREIGLMGLRAGSSVKYENRGEEHFYGLGPDTSLGDGTSYRMERTTLEGILGYEFLDTWDLAGKLAYQNVNITNGEDGGRGIIDEIFVATGRQRIPGLGGDEILSWGLDLKHDNRDDQEWPTKGGYQRLHFSFNKGMESSSGFFKYRGEAAHFFKLFSERRILGLRGVVEHNDEVGDREVPFFAMARLGGYGTSPRYGDTHRGFRRDRFYDESLLLFNVEYRWTVWEYRDRKLDSVLFWDLGQVFGEWSNLQFKDFRSSYGFGLRAGFKGKVLLAIEVARSHEGMEFYAKTKTPF